MLCRKGTVIHPKALEPAMQTLLNLIAPANAPNPGGLFEDGRDKWVGLVSAVGLCALLASDLISLL